MVFAEDMKYRVQIVPLWINTPLIYKKIVDEMTNKTVTVIRAPTMVTDIDAGLYPDSAGYHYCKLLSPARAMEYLYCDGLRDNDSLP